MPIIEFYIWNIESLKSFACFIGGNFNYLKAYNYVKRRKRLIEIECRNDVIEFLLNTRVNRGERMAW